MAARYKARDLARLIGINGFMNNPDQAMHEQVQSYITSLKLALIDYKNNRPHLSWRAIAKNSGVNRYFINKVLDDDNSGSPSKIFDLTQALLLQSYLSEKVNFGEAIDSCPQPFRDLLSRVFKTTMESKSLSEKPFKLLPESETDDPDLFSIMCMAAFRKPFTKKKMCELLGEASAGKLENLIERGLVVVDENNEVRIPGDDSTYIIPHEMLPVHIPKMIRRFYKVRNRALQKNHLYFTADSLSESAYARLYDMHMDFLARAIEFVETAEVGDIPIFMFGGFDTIVRDSTSDNE